MVSYNREIRPLMSDKCFTCHGPAVNKVKAGLKKKMWLIQSSELAGKARIMLWHTLFKSRWSYGHQLLTTIDKKFREWVKSCYYEGIKTMFNIKSNPRKEDMFDIGFG